MNKSVYCIPLHFKTADNFFPFQGYMYVPVRQHLGQTKQIVVRHHQKKKVKFAQGRFLFDLQGLHPNYILTLL